MEKYPRIKELGLYTEQWPSRDERCHWIIADDLERLLANGKTLYKLKDGDLWSPEKHHLHVLQGLIIGRKAIPTQDPRATKIEELEKKVQDIMKELEGLKG
jgi:hypothetical protein